MRAQHGAPLPSPPGGHCCFTVTERDSQLGEQTVSLCSGRKEDVPAADSEQLPLLNILSPPPFFIHLCVKVFILYIYLYFSLTILSQCCCWLYAWSLPTDQQPLLERGQPSVMGTCHSTMPGIQRTTWPEASWGSSLSPCPLQTPVFSVVQQFPPPRGLSLGERCQQSYLG